jgi:hypothetical protein
MKKNQALPKNCSQKLRSVQVAEVVMLLHPWPTRVHCSRQNRLMATPAQNVLYTWTDEVSMSPVSVRVLVSSMFLSVSVSVVPVFFPCKWSVVTCSASVVALSGLSVISVVSVPCLMSPVLVQRHLTPVTGNISLVPCPVSTVLCPLSCAPCPMSHYSVPSPVSPHQCPLSSLPCSVSPVLCFTLFYVPCPVNWFKCKF